MTTFSIEATFPPSLAGEPVLAMLTVMGFWWAVLICLQWIYTTIDDWFDRPAPRGSYIRVKRQMKLWLIGSILIVSAPRLIQLMLWQRFDAGDRELIASLSWLTRIPASFMLVVGWYLDKRLVATEREYTGFNGHYPALTISWSEKTRGALILVLIFVVAAVTTFVRPTDVRTSPPVVIERR